MSQIPNTPLGLPNPGQPPLGPMGQAPAKTVNRWDFFLGDLASGMGLEKSMEKNYICRADIETFCRLNDGGVESQRFREASLAGRKRSRTVFEYRDFFGKVAEGMTIKEAQEAAWGCYDSSVAQLIVEDAELNELYRRALEARSLGMAEEVIGIVDDDSRDTLDGPKGGEIPNMAAVGRSKLKAETRLRVAGNWNNKLYGEKKDNVNVQVNINHAEVLEAARERAKNRGAVKVAPRQLQHAIDAVFSEKTAEEDTTWMDDKPTDTVWREEQ